MAILKNRIVHFLLIISAIILFDLISFEIAMPADNTSITIDENLTPGMNLKDAIGLLGAPEKMMVSDTGTVIIPYETLGLSLEILSGGTLIESIHINASFKGKFASGIGVGEDFQKILSAYNQPDIMTKEIIEYSDSARRFYLKEGKLAGADLYSSSSTLFRHMENKAPSQNIALQAPPVQVISEEADKEEVRQALREELREEVREELREETIKGLSEDFDVFEHFGFKVKQTSKGVIVIEIKPGSAAEKGGLKLDTPIRKAFYEGAGKLNIYSISGLESILKRVVVKHKKIINILQDEHYYYKIEVPKRT